MYRKDQNTKKKRCLTESSLTLATLTITKCVFFSLPLLLTLSDTGERQRPQTVPVCRIILQCTQHLCLQRDPAALCLPLFH